MRLKVGMVFSSWVTTMMEVSNFRAMSLRIRITAMARVGRKVRDKRLLALIGKYLRAGALVGETIQATALGTPQGGPLSPLLANILLDDLDKELERRGHRFVRYADDLLILVKSRRAGERVMASVTRFLTRKLKLVVNEHKSRVVPTNECTYLGFTFRGKKLRWSDRAFGDFRYHLRRLTGRSWGVSMDYRLKKLAQYVRGWMATSASPTTTARSPSWTAGCADGCACANGSSGASRAPRFATCSSWGRASARPSVPG